MGRASRGNVPDNHPRIKMIASHFSRQSWRQIGHRCTCQRVRAPQLMLIPCRDFRGMFQKQVYIEYAIRPANSKFCGPTHNPCGNSKPKTLFVKHRLILNRDNDITGF